MPGVHDTSGDTDHQISTIYPKPVASDDSAAAEIMPSGRFVQAHYHLIPVKAPSPEWRLNPLKLRDAEGDKSRRLTHFRRYGSVILRSSSFLRLLRYGTKGVHESPIGMVADFRDSHCHASGMLVNCCGRNRRSRRNSSVRVLKISEPLSLAGQTVATAGVVRRALLIRRTRWTRRCGSVQRDTEGCLSSAQCSS